MRKFHASIKDLNFNPLPPHGGRRGISRNVIFHCIISIHSLRMEGDTVKVTSSEIVQPFQSTPSAWRETFRHQTKRISFIYFNPLPPHGGRLFQRSQCVVHWIISIHSLRMEGDQVDSWCNLCAAHFNPLPPHGGRPMREISRIGSNQFQSTPSAWRETTTQL